MIHSAYKLLKSLINLVETDEDEIWIDYENKRFERVHDDTKPDFGCSFPPKEPSVKGLLDYLQENGYIIMEGYNEYCTLTYKALYYKQIVRNERLRYFLCSVFVPIILSVITSILTTTFLPELLSSLLQKLQ